MGPLKQFAVGLVVGLVLMSSVWAEADNKEAPSANTQTVILGVDGLSYRAFMQAQKMGLFSEFKNVGANISPFPSMTDLSWATFAHTAELFGAEGRIKSVEATYFDESTRSIQGYKSSTSRAAKRLSGSAQDTRS